MFFIEAGEKLELIGRKNARGQWHFLFESCHWRFSREDAVLVGSEDEPEILDERFGILDLGFIEDIQITRPANDLAVQFSSGVRLSTFTASQSTINQWAQWRLFCPDDIVYVIDGGGNISVQKGGD